jgi:hypothetical protein
MMEKEFNIYISNENIQNVNIQKLLGIYLDHNLDWKNQIDYICKNISSRLFLFAKILCFVPISMHVVFVGFITILLFVHHMFTEFRSSFKVASISNIFL